MYKRILEIMKKNGELTTRELEETGISRVYLPKMENVNNMFKSQLQTSYLQFSNEVETKRGEKQIINPLCLLIYTANIKDKLKDTCPLYDYTVSFI